MKEAHMKGHRKGRQFSLIHANPTVGTGGRMLAMSGRKTRSQREMEPECLVDLLHQVNGQATDARTYSENIN
ncbi:MAG: hypothetical protein QOJ03_1415 [Frankiaceae bacterium]|nr:hypothetical protein [Frankiaceae bacterium]